MMKKIKAEIMAWDLDRANATTGFTTSFAIPAWLPEPYRMIKRYTLTLNLQRIDRVPVPPIN